MASPDEPPTQSQSQPLTPPADPPNSNAQPSTTAAAAAAAAQPSTALPSSTLPSHPPTSLSDPGTSKRPRDARLIHLILASLGVSAYQERVPLQLLDFAYRYTSSVLSDAAHIQAEGYDISHEFLNVAGGGGRGARGKVGGAGAGGSSATGMSGAGASGTGGAGVGSGSGGEKEEVSLASLRMAIGSRMQYQYQGSLPKEFLMGLAKERNRIGLGVGRSLPNAQVQDPATAAATAGQMIGGIKLPPEKYCLTGVGWGLREEWDSDGDEEIPSADVVVGDGMGENAEDFMGMGNGAAEEEDDADAEATMEDIFGSHGGGDGEDEDMQDG